MIEENEAVPEQFTRFVSSAQAIEFGEIWRSSINIYQIDAISKLLIPNKIDSSG